MSSLVRSLSLVGLVGGLLTVFAVPSQNADAQKSPKKLAYNKSLRGKTPLDSSRPNPVTTILYTRNITVPISGQFIPAGTTVALRANKNFFALIELNPDETNEQWDIILSFNVQGYKADGTPVNIPVGFLPAPVITQLPSGINCPAYIKIPLSFGNGSGYQCEVGATAQLYRRTDHTTPVDRAIVKRWSLASTLW